MMSLAYFGRNSTFGDAWFESRLSGVSSAVYVRAPATLIVAVSEPLESLINRLSCDAGIAAMP